MQYISLVFVAVAIAAVVAVCSVLMLLYRRCYFCVFLPLFLFLLLYIYIVLGFVTPNGEACITTNILMVKCMWKSEGIRNWKIKVENELSQVRREISIASAEIHRLEHHGKLTRKGKKNKTFLGRKRRKLKSAAQVYMCSLRNKKFAKELARKRKRKSQQETRKRWNNTYINQPTRIHISMRECITKDPDNPRPKVEDYLGTCDSGESHGNCFESLEQAETFWRPIWEIEGNGNADALSWLKEIESAMDTCCDIARQMNDDPICVCKDQIEKAIRKKKNWSAPGPDGICNYWFKKLTAMHQPFRPAQRLK